MSAESAVTGTDLTALYRDALEAIREALDIPHAATVGWNEKRQEILDRRLSEVMSTLRFVLETDRSTDDVAWHTAYLRKRLVELPADGYVTYGEARAAVKRGASWMEAVAEPREVTICCGCCAPVLGVHTSRPGPLVGRTVESVR